MTAFAIPVGLTYKIEMNDQHDPKKSFIFHNVDCIDVDSNSWQLDNGYICSMGTDTSTLSAKLAIINTHDSQFQLKHNLKMSFNVTTGLISN